MLSRNEKLVHNVLGLSKKKKIGLALWENKQRILLVDLSISRVKFAGFVSGIVDCPLEAY